MKKYLSIFVLCLIPFYSLATEVDFKSVITTALENSSAVKISEKNVEKSFADLAISESYGLPSVTLSGGISRKKTGDKTSKSSSVGVTAGYYLFNGGKTVNSINVANNNKQKAIITHKKNVSSVIVQVAQIYYGVKRYRVIKNSYTVALENTKKVMEIEKIKFESGAADKTLYLDAQSNYYDTKAKLGDVESILSSLNTRYYNVTGTEIPKDLPDANLSALETIKSLDEAVEKAKKNNPNVKIAKLDLQNADYNYLIALASHSPTLSVSASVRRKNNLNDNEVSGGINYSLPLFNGGRDLANTTKGKIVKQQSEMQFKKVVDDAEVSAINAWRNYLSAKETLSAYKKSFDSAKMTFEIEQIRYKNKTTESTKLLDVQNEKILAEQKYVWAIENSIVSVLNLLIATGEFDMETLENIK